MKFVLISCLSFSIQSVSAKDNVCTEKWRKRRNTAAVNPPEIEKEIWRNWQCNGVEKSIVRNIHYLTNKLLSRFNNWCVNFAPSILLLLFDPSINDGQIHQQMDRQTDRATFNRKSATKKKPNRLFSLLCRYGLNLFLLSTIHQWFFYC